MALSTSERQARYRQRLKEAAMATISVDVRVGDAWFQPSEPIANVTMKCLPNIGDAIQVGTLFYSVLSVGHHGVDSPDGHYAVLLVKRFEQA